ncbi:hypothetical protein Acr_13g0006730 [Actinidia rufa]|uniref:Uncharacterized protein n=1 Tax=Actinidia rufa TaxID=165716 RepID=A0A7J0FKP8_9ERIC|nr:hypothetical protein Acr_13g0006730 [Actinidia rufa]
MGVDWVLVVQVQPLNFTVIESNNPIGSNDTIIAAVIDRNRGGEGVNGLSRAALEGVLMAVHRQAGSGVWLGHVVLSLNLLSAPFPPSQSQHTAAREMGEENEKRTDAQPEGTQSGITEKDPQTSSSGSLSSARTQLGLLDQLTSTISTVDGYESDGSSSQKLTIRNQLAQLVGDQDDDFSIPLGKNLTKISPKFLTTSQKRNIRRQTYLDEVSQRNDTVFFATIGAFVILPPLIILGIAILTGYVQLFP